MAIVLKTISDSKEAQDDLAKLRQSVNNIESSARSVSESFANFTKILAAGTAILGVATAYTKISDRLTQLDSKLRVATESQLEFNIAVQQTRNIAIRTNADLDSITSTYGRLLRASRDFGASQSQVADLTDIIAKSLRISGATAQEASSTLLQFGQALSSGRLAGEELRAILENAPPLAKAIADGLGVSIGQLRKLGEEGELSAARVFKAILSQKADIDKTFSKVQITYGQAFTNLGTAFTVLAIEIKKSILGSTGSLAEEINKIANVIFDFANLFGINLLRAKLKLLVFAADTEITLKTLWKDLKQTAENVRGFLSEIYDEWKPFLKNLLSDIALLSGLAGAALISLVKGFVTAFTNSSSQDLFKGLKASISDAYSKFNQFSSTILSKWLPTLSSIGSEVLKIGNNVSIYISTVVTSLFKRLSESNFGQAFTRIATKTFSDFSTLISNTFNKIYNKIPKINLDFIFLNLNKSLTIIKNWAQTAEKWFAWLYDKVVGNSWVPDLVTQTVDWFKKLNINSGSLIESFIKRANSLFGSLKFATIFSAFTSILSKFNSKLLIIVGTVLTLVAVLASLKANNKLNLKFNIEQIKETTIDKLNKAVQTFKTAIDTLKTKVQTFFEKPGVGDTNIVRNLKQFLGMRDVVPGNIYNEGINTDALVGRGPMRNQETRMFGHDFINMLPSNWQIPTIAAFTSVFALAIVAATEKGFVRSALLSALTTGAGIFAARNVYDKQLNETGGKIAFAFLDIVEKGVTALFSGNVLKDPLGVISTIAKTSLLFEQGQKFLGGLAKDIITAPTKAASNFSAVLERAAIRRTLKTTDTQIQQLPNERRLLNTLSNQQQDLRTLFRNLARQTDSTGQQIGGARVRTALESRQLNALGPQRAGDLARLIGQSDLVQATRNSVTSQRDLRDSLNKSRTSLTEREGAISQVLGQNAVAFREGIKNFSSGIGGILGGLAGLQIGAEIARGMENSPAWVKTGVVIAASFAGQAILATAGNLIAQFFIASVSKAGNLLTSSFGAVIGLLRNPFILGATIIGSAIIAALNWDKLKEGIEFVKPKLIEAWKEISPELEKLFQNFLNSFSDIVDRIRQRGGERLDRPITQIPGTETQISGRDIFTVGPAIAFFAWLGNKANLFEPIKIGLSNFISSIVSYFSTGSSNSLLTIFRNAVVAIGIQIGSFSTGLTPALFTVFNNLVTSIKNLFPNITNNIQTALLALTGIGAVITSALSAPALLSALTAALIGGLTYGIYKAFKAASEYVFPPEGKLPEISGPSQNPLINAIPRANGGWITGPGSGTSDSIPAMLSNGEFVVNARDAKKNWKLLTAINSGQTWTGFKEGTKTTSKKYLNDFDENTSERLAKDHIASLANGLKVSVNFLENTEAAFYPHNYKIDTYDIKRPDQDSKYLVALHELGHANNYKNLFGKGLHPVPINDDMIYARFASGTGEVKELADEFFQNISKEIFSKSFLKFFELQNKHRKDKDVPESVNGIRSIFEKQVNLLYSKTKNKDSASLQIDNEKYKLDDIINSSLPVLEDPNAIRIKAEIPNQLFNLGKGFYSSLDKYQKESLRVILEKDFLKFRLQEEFTATDYALKNAKWKNPEAVAGLAAAFRTYLHHLAIEREKQDIRKLILLKFKSQFSNQTTAQLAADFADDGIINKSVKISEDPLLNLKKLRINKENVLNDDLQEVSEASKIKIKRAYGGWISGPGTATSDSIPAMLSNGEFVVNARDAQKNRQLLTAINSGASFKGFQSGTQKLTVSPTDSETLPKILDYLKKLFESLKNPSSTPLLNPKPPSSTDTTSTAPLDATIDSLVQNAKTFDKGLIRLSDTLKQAGYEKVDLKKIREFAELKPSQFLTLAKSISEVEAAFKTAANPEVSAVFRNSIIETATALARSVSDAVQASGIGVPAGKLIETPKEEDPTKLTLGDMFKQVQEIFPELGLTLEEFQKFNTQTRTALLTPALDLSARLKALSKTEIGTVEGGLTKSPEALSELVQRESDLNDTRLFFVNSLREDIKSLRSPFADFKLDFASLGVNISQEVFNRLTEFDKSVLIGLKNKLQTVDEQLNSPEIYNNPIAVSALQQLKKNLTDKINNVLTLDPDRFTNTFENVSKRLNKAGIQLDEAVYNLIPITDFSLIESLAEEIRANREKARLLRLKNTAEAAEEAKEIQLSINEAADKINEFIKKSTPGYKTKAELAAETFATELGESFYSGMAEFAKGRVTLTDALKSIANKLTESIVNTFIKGLMDPITSEKGLINTFIKDLGKGIFSSGTADLKSLFPSLNFAATGVSTINPYTGFTMMSSGGYLKGPGTATSDSIPAFLSNGEFVVRASAVKDNLDLLQAINNNQIKRFSEGGLVNTSITSVPTMIEPEKKTESKSNSQQVFNINITGDISRQTKAEIYQMLPSIAEGVNSHNREKGYRR